MIEFCSVTMGFSGKNILENCSFSMKNGEHIAIMGPSGSGKTTILRLIAGQLTPNAGTVDVSAEKISYMFQEHRLLPWLTAEENVNLVLGDRNTTLEQARQWLEVVGLRDSLGKRPSQLSGGMRQRVSLARALAYGGDLFLLDEPMSALDADMTDEMLSLLKEHTQCKSLIFVTHSLEQAQKITDKIYIVKDKKIGTM